MFRHCALVLGVSMFVVASSRGDLPLPNDIKYIDPRVSFDGIDQYPDQVFYLRFITFSGGPNGVPPTLIEVKDSKAFNLNAQRRLTNMQLLTMNRDAFNKLAKDDAKLKFMNDKTEGVVAANLKAPPTTAPVTTKEGPVTTYRVKLKDGKLTVEPVEEKKRSQALPKVPPLWVVGIVGSLCMAALGLWFTRRRPA